jgi:hypothetical protein
MGTYLTIQLSDRCAAEDMNARYLAMFPVEREEARYLRNWDQKRNTHTVHFYTQEDLVADARFLRDKAKRTDLGITPGMSDEQVIRIMRMQFPGWVAIGSYELKLSAQSLCSHRLKRLKRFIDKELIPPFGGKVTGLSDLNRYLRIRLGWDAECYCSACKAQAAAAGVALPIRHQTPRSNVIVDANGRIVTEQYSRLLGIPVGTRDKDSAEDSTYRAQAAAI